jgi:regulator of cell morphogenesis and NO signaling
VKQIVNTYYNKDYFPEKELLSFSPPEIVSYLRKTHKYYIDYVLPKLDSLLEQLIKSSSSISKDLQMVDEFHIFEKEHTNVDEKFNDLKNLIIKYATPDYDENTCNEFLITLYRFEKDKTFC